MAPEQVLGRSAVDGRTDIYAVGCLAYWLLTGHLVFEGETPMEIMMHHAKTVPLPGTDIDGVLAAGYNGSDHVGATEEPVTRVATNGPVLE